MIYFKYIIEKFSDLKGYRLIILNREMFCLLWFSGFIRFKIFGRGVILKNLALHNKTISELTSNEGRMFKMWYIKTIK